ncbi:MAG TPA: chromate transporter [Aliidongia sp.]|uniref:chromate transporter n=1 Tax=Aliidongia sp. TaxID=1914230 RepID=UPI002DDD34B2|nr:chromate transporter [Aliidongia sp.]HEV2677002.1 chromate transporter [Aliidongia sp.]
MRDSPLLALLVTFAPLSLASIGGGLSILSDIQHQSVDVHHWLTQAQFLDDFGISRAAPGPSSLIVTLIGYQVAGWAGAIVASIAIFLPSSVLVYGLARIWRRYRGAPWQAKIERGLAPIAAGLILAGALNVLRTAEGGWLAWAVAAGSTLLLLRHRALSPFVLLGAGAAIFAVANLV